MSLIQKEIADFSAQCYQNNTFRAVTKADVLGKWSVFFFYPADFTFVCPTELEDLANLYDKFQAIGCEVYSVSCDTHFVHKAWHDASERIQKIQYPMLADPTHCLAKDFEVYIEADGVAERGEAKQQHAQRRHALKGEGPEGEPCRGGREAHVTPASGLRRRRGFPYPSAAFPQARTEP